MEKEEKELYFDNDALDYMDTELRKKTIFSLFKKQFIHNKNEVDFYAKLYQNTSEDQLASFEDCIEKVPTLTKDQIRNLNSPYNLLGKEFRKNLNRIHLHRGTGGTTGEPTSMFFSRNDWEAVLGGMTRSLTELRSLQEDIVAFNGYNQGHISGPIFDDTIRRIGGIPITRNFGCSDEQALRQMKKHRCNLIIAPPITTHKGGSIESLLDVDAKLGLNYITGEHVHTIFCSSTQLTKELFEELKDLGIRNIYNYYGSTDVLPTAISCQHNPSDLHILFGHIALFVINEKQEHVKNGERGLVVAGRIGSYDDKGVVIPNQATQLLNFHVGDEVTFIDTPCPCGRTTPRIRRVKRVHHVQDKLEGGCEHW